MWSKLFRDSPVGIVAISQMAAGDGMADIVGRSFFVMSYKISQNESAYDWKCPHVFGILYCLQTIWKEKVALCTHKEHCGLGCICRFGIPGEHCAAGADGLYRYILNWKTWNHLLVCLVCHICSVWHCCCWFDLGRDIPIRCSRQDLDDSGHFRVQCCCWTNAWR